MSTSHDIAFGTSGLRGRAEAFSGDAVRRYVGAFLDTACAHARERTVWIGADLRASSPGIAASVAAAALAAGWTPRHAGVMPTPALASFALAAGVPAIMVTGSHIPADYNGIKFYRPDGELLKSDEAPIRAAAENAVLPEPPAAPDLPAPDPAVAEAYLERFRAGFKPGALAGLRVGVFEHSAAGRDLLAAALEDLGAQCIRFGASADFIAVDTEAVSPEQMAQMRAAQARHGLDAVVSTDGDGDRPLVLDERGAQVNGDILGVLTARALDAATIVTPLTSTGAIEMSGWFKTVIRTRIGSPFVVEAMAGADGDIVVGFEANGGFLLGSPLAREGGTLAPLPTRDALLPILAVLAESARRAAPLSRLVAELPARAMRADRLKNVPPMTGNDFVAAMAQSRAERAAFDAALADPEAIDTRDGTRLTFADGAVVHFRQSGNAPELRCYVETGSASETGALLERMMARLASRFSA